MRRTFPCLPVVLFLFLTISHAARAATPGVYVLQPSGGLNDGTDNGSASRGKDTSVWDYLEENEGNAGRASLLNDPLCGVEGRTVARGYLRFALKGMPVRGVLSAKVTIWANIRHRGRDWAEDPVIGLRRVTDAWNEMSLVYSNSPPVYDSLDADTQTAAGAVNLRDGDPDLNVPLTFDITSLYSEWAQGSFLNHGLLITQENPICLTGPDGYADMYYWTSDTLRHPSWRPKLEVTTNVVFFDDFSDGVAGESDWQWETALGSWKVAEPPGYPGGQVLKSSADPVAAALVREAEITTYPFMSGRITARFKISGADTLTDARFLFDSLAVGKYRCVQIRQFSTGWVLRILQAGRYDGDVARVAKTVSLRGFDARNWHRLEIDVAPDGRVRAVLYDEGVAARKWRISGSFSRNSGGDVGVLARGTVIMVDDYLLEADPRGGALSSGESSPSKER